MGTRNLVGLKFGKWTVLKRIGSDDFRNILWLCECDCGIVRGVRGRDLKNKRSNSCGCIQKEYATPCTGDKNPHWKGGVRINLEGYVMEYLPAHPRASYGYVREHLLLVERAIRKPLPNKSEVHHYGERSDNSKIVLCQDRKYHCLLHKRARNLC